MTMIMKPYIPACKVVLPPIATLAFHFRFIEGGEWASSTTVAVRLLARVIWSVRPYLAETGSLIVRMEKLFYTQELGSALETSWSSSARNTRRWPAVDPRTITDRDRVFTVVISGRLAGLASLLFQRLSRPCHHQFLLGLLVNPDDLLQARVYLGRRCTPIGVLHSDSSFELAFTAIEYEPQMERMLRLLQINPTMSASAVSTALGLVHPLGRA